MEIDPPPGATPIDPDEADGLIPPISTQGELNEFEARNIVSATLWAIRSRQIKSDFLSDHTLCELHRQMFGNTWRWAGTYRQTQKSIGCESWKISEAMRNLVEDVKVWLDQESYSATEIAARFHHRLTWIHPFANGNGRFARFATDILCEQRGWPASHWGRESLTEPSRVRSEYIAALQSADQNDFKPLIQFMRS